MFQDVMRRAKICKCVGSSTMCKEHIKFGNAQEKGAGNEIQEMGRKIFYGDGLRRGSTLLARSRN